MSYTKNDIEALNETEKCISDINKRAPALYLDFYIDVQDVWKAFAELIATMFFIMLSLTAVQSALNPTMLSSPPPAILSASSILLIATGFGLAVMICISAVAHISGGHLNPAVTVAFYASGMIKPTTGLLYIVAQIIGAIIGAGFADVITPGKITLNSRAIDGI